MLDKKIKFSAEENVSQTINKLKRDSEELGRGFIRDARAYTTSGKETLSYIEEQIKAIERRNRADKQTQSLLLETQRQRGQLSESGYKKGISDVAIGSRTDEKQVALLREMIETIKFNAKRELIEDRKGVDKQILNSKTVNKLSPGGSEFHILKETLQRQQLGDVKSREYEERSNFGIKDKAQRAVDTAGGVAMQSNQFFALASTLAFIPIVGQAASNIAQKALSSSQRYQAAAGSMTQLTGKVGYFGRGTGFDAIGMTKADFLELNKQVAVARGGEAGSNRATGQLALFQKATGLDMGTLLEQEKLTRGGGYSASAGNQRLTKGLQAVGVIKGQDISLLGEYLPLLINIQQEQLRVAGKTNNEIATNLVAGIASLDTSFKNPAVLRGVLPAITGGFKNPSTPQVEALQFRALSKLNPGASLYGLEEMRELPSLEMISGLLGQLKNVSPNAETFSRNIKGTFSGLSYKQARLIGEGFTREGDKFNLGDYSKELGITNIGGRASGATSTLDKSSAAWTQTFETVGKDLTDVIQKLVDDNLPAAMKGLTGAVKEGEIYHLQHMNARGFDIYSVISEFFD